MSENSHYAEYSVTRQNDGKKGKNRKLSLIVFIFSEAFIIITLFVLFGSVGFYFSIPFFIVSYLIFVPVFMYKFNVEYDYVVVDGELTVSEIRNKKIRKNISVVKFSEAEALVPLRDEYRDVVKAREYDSVVEAVSSLSSDRIYAVISIDDENKKQELLLFEPSDKILKIMSIYNRKTVVKSK